MCNRVILLDGGRQISSGTAEEVVRFYLESGAQLPSEMAWRYSKTAPGNDRALIYAVRILDSHGQVTSQTDLESSFNVEIEYRVLVPNTVLNLSISLFNQDDVYVLASPSITDAKWYQRPHPAGLYRSRCAIPGKLLNQGSYKISALLVENGRHIAAQLDRVVSVELVDLGQSRGGYFGYWGGVVRPELNWTTEHTTQLG